jgi:tetratricopeptide (TPR) repeat protein
VSFDDIAERLERRLKRYMRRGKADLVLSDVAMEEAAALRQALDTEVADPDHPTAEDDRRASDAMYLLGWLFAARSSARKPAPDPADAARAVVYLAPLASDPEAIPEAMHAVLGRQANARSQASLGLELLRHAGTRDDSMIWRAGLSMLSEALTGTPADDPTRPALLAALAHAHRERYDLKGDPADLDRAIDAGEEAVTAMPPGHVTGYVWLTRLGTAYRARHALNLSPTDVERAVRLLRRAVDSVSGDNPDRPAMLSSLGSAYLDRFLADDAAADLDQAIRFFSQAVRTLPAGDSNRPRIVFNLGLGRLRRYWRWGELADLDRAIELIEQAVTTGANDPAWSTWLSNLSIAYEARYRRNSVLADLDRAISIGERAVAATPEGHHERPGCLSNLGIAYQTRFSRRQKPSDLDHAVALHEAAVASTPEGRPDQPRLLFCLSLCYFDRYRTFREATDLDRAIESGERAITLEPVEPADRPQWLSNLGVAYRERYDDEKNPADLDRAVALFEQAIAACPENHPSLAVFVGNLGGAHLAQSTDGAREISPETLSVLARQLRATVSASPAHRANAGHAVGSLAHEMGEHHTAMEVLDMAVAMLPSVTSQDAGWAEREHRLGDHLGVVWEAIAAHCACGDYTGAAEVAELGRGVLLANQMDSRTDLTNLDLSLPSLAKDLRRVRDYLNAPDSGMPGERARWWARHDEILAEVRQHPAFSRFLLPPRLADLRSSVTDGTVVLVNAGSRRADAILLHSSRDPVHIPLPDLALNDVRDHADVLLASHHTTGGLAGAARITALSSILAWLWDTIAEPVIRALPSTAPSTRVWWLPTGLLGLFPLHAAGHPGQPGALDAVVSSYTPTLRALAHAHDRPAAATRRQLVVALEQTPDHSDLPGTVAEARDLYGRHAGARLLDGEGATTGRVLTALSDATWAHFACHASVDHSAPSHGGLRLHDGTLTIPEISRLQLPNAELAYLSACATADRGWRYAEECIHLASAFQLAGFRHVVATLWPVDDDLATAAAQAFYRALPSTPAPATAAATLNQVTRDLRVRHPTRPDLWANLIHSGP